MSSYLATSGLISTWAVPCLISGKLSESPSNLFLDIFKYLILLVLSDSLPIDLKVESHGDGLRFLDGLTDGALSWDKGTADLRFLIKGIYI